MIVIIPLGYSIRLGCVAGVFVGAGLLKVEHRAEGDLDDADGLVTEVGHVDLHLVIPAATAAWESGSNARGLVEARDGAAIGISAHTAGHSPHFLGRSVDRANAVI